MAELSGKDTPVESIPSGNTWWDVKNDDSSTR